MSAIKLDIEGVKRLYINSMSAGKHLASSPFKCQVEAGAVEAQSSRLFGPGLQAVQLGRESQVFVELADAFGNQIKSATAAAQTVLQVSQGWAVRQLGRGC